MGMIDKIRSVFGYPKIATESELAKREPMISGEEEHSTKTTEKGRRSSAESQLNAVYRKLSVDYALRALISDIRHMDRSDGRVKRIHNRVARDVTRGGLVLVQPDPDERIEREWKAFVKRLQLDNAQKLKSDARGLLMEGNLPYQWVLNERADVIAGIRMPAETISPNVGDNGRFVDVKAAYSQMDANGSCEIAQFPLWQLTLARLDPDNYDDLFCMGRPFLDANRVVWRKLGMTDTDLVVRRHHRAPLRLSHTLEGATKPELDAYIDRTESNKDLITTDFYQNIKGGVVALQGDATLGDIQDVIYLLDTFFAGTPLPKGLMGYTDGMARDILEDLKRDYYDEVDQMQEIQAWVYAQGFHLHLLLKGINPSADDFEIRFRERRTESKTQTTDRALKLSAMGLPKSMVWEELGFNAVDVEARRVSDAKNYNPYPEPNITPKISITPGNGGKGDSSTDIKG